MLKAAGYDTAGELFPAAVTWTVRKQQLMEVARVIRLLADPNDDTLETSVCALLQLTFPRCPCC
jgi:hypothetical protein